MIEPKALPALEPSLLPDASSPDLFVTPVDLPEYEQTWLLNFDEWRGPLDMSQYLQREKFLNKQDLTKNGGITAWILTSNKLPTYPDGTRPVLAACETILKPAFVSRNGTIEKVRAHGIASVFTRLEYRGRGYAGRMMAELGKQLDTYQQAKGDKATFSVLFSDIGPKYYSRFGWKTYPSTHLHLQSLDTKHYQSTKSRFPEVLDMKQEDVSQSSAVTYLERALNDVSKQNPNVACVAIQPDEAHFRWHHAREEIQAELLDLPFPEVKGAMHKPTGISIVWARVLATDPKEWSLHVLHIAIPPALRINPTEEARDAIAALLLRAQHEASVWNMADGVEVWDPSEFVISAAQSLRTEEQGQVSVVRRDKEHLCCIRWIGARPEDDPTKDVIWFSAEKYGWC